jgi:hypothetical protein
LVAYHPEKFSARASFSKKNLSSDGHFGRPFSFMAVKENTSTTIRTKNMKTLHVTKLIHRSPFRRALLLIAPALVIIAVLTAVPAAPPPNVRINRHGAD